MCIDSESLRADALAGVAGQAVFSMGLWKKSHDSWRGSMCEVCLFCIYPAHSCVDCPFPEHRNTVVTSPSQQPLKGQRESVRTHNSALAELLMALNEDWWLNCCSGGWIRCRMDQLTSFSPNEKHINIITGFFSRSPATLSDEMLSHEMQWRLLPEN